MTAQKILSRPVISIMVAGLIEVFTLFSTVNARDLFDQAIKEIIELFIKANIAIDVVKKHIDDVFTFVKSIAPQDNIELLLCALMVICELLGVYEFLQPYTHKNHPGEKLLEISSKCKQQLFKRPDTPFNIG